MPIFGGHLCCILRMGRDTGFEPVNGRFTAGCVSPLHQFRQRHIVYSSCLMEARKISSFDGLLCSSM